MEYQRLPGPDEVADVVEAIRQAFGQEPDAIEVSPTQGSVNWTLCATVNGRQYAVRLNRARDVDSALAEYARERWSMRAAQSAGIQTPSVVALARSARRAWMIRDWVVGRPCDPTDPNAYLQLGLIARRLASANVSRDPSLFGDSFGGPHGQLRYNLAALGPNDRLLALGAYAPHHVATIESALQRLQDEALPVAFHHGDLAPEHLLCAPSGETVLVDWGNAGFAVTPLEQINDVRREQFNTGTPTADCLTAFLEGMGIEAPLQHSLLPVLNQWLLLRALDLVRWAHDQCLARVPELVAKARFTVEAFSSGALPLHLA